MWVSERGAGAIAVITTAGQVSTIQLPPGAEPDGTVTGPDGNVWVTPPPANAQNGPRRRRTPAEFVADVER